MRPARAHSRRPHCFEPQAYSGGLRTAVRPELLEPPELALPLDELPDEPPDDEPPDWLDALDVRPTLDPLDPPLV